MADQTHRARDAPQDHRRHSISAKIIFLVFLCTLSTEVIVSWIAIQATQAEMRDHVDRDFPATLERSREALSSWLTPPGVPTLRCAGAPAGDVCECLQLWKSSSC